MLLEPQQTEHKPIEIAACEMTTSPVSLPQQLAESGQLREQFAESERLEAVIKQNLGGLGYDL